MADAQDSILKQLQIELSESFGSRGWLDGGRSNPYSSSSSEIRFGRPG